MIARLVNQQSISNLAIVIQIFAISNMQPHPIDFDKFYYIPIDQNFGISKNSDSFHNSVFMVSFVNVCVLQSMKDILTW